MMEGTNGQTQHGVQLKVGICNVAFREGKVNLNLVKIFRDRWQFDGDKL